MAWLTSRSVSSRALLRLPGANRCGSSQSCSRFSPTQIRALHSLLDTACSGGKTESYACREDPVSLISATSKQDYSESTGHEEDNRAEDPERQPLSQEVARTTTCRPNTRSCEAMSLSRTLRSVLSDRTRQKRSFRIGSPVPGSFC